MKIMPTAPSVRQSLFRLLSGVLLNAVLLSAVLLSGCQSSQTSKPSGSDQETSLRETLELHNKGVGFLENMQWKDADSVLAQLAQRLPANVDAARNLAICRTLSLISNNSPYSASKDPAAFVARISETQLSIEAFRKLALTDQEKAIAKLLEGKLAAFEDTPGKPRIEDALKHLQEAIRLSGDRPDMWYASAAAMDGNRDYSESADLLRALLRLSEMVPENLAVLGRLLEKQALGMNSKDPEVVALSQDLAKTLERAATLLEPLNPAIKKQRNVDLVDTIRKALVALPEKDSVTPADSKKLVGPAMMTTRLLLPELASQIDRRRIDLNLLEYIVVDLAKGLTMPDDVRSRLSPAAEATVLKAFTTAEQLPDVSQVTQAQFCDMNLDGVDDLVLVEDGRIRVYSRGTATPAAPAGPAAPSAEWTLLMESPVDAGRFTRCLLVDLDRDFDRALSDIKSPSVLRDRDGDRKIVKDQAGQQRWFDTDAEVVAWNAEGVVIFRNDLSVDGVRSFTVLPQSEGLSGINDIVAADLEADGDLDLIFGTTAGMSLWKNLDGKTFEPITEGLSLPADSVVAMAIGDWNRDMAMDVVGVTADGKAGWLQNMLHTRFRWLDGIPCPAGATDVFIDELNHDGHWDLVVAGASGVSSILPANNEVPKDAVMNALSSSPVTGIHRADLDNDGRSDVVAFGPGGIRLLRGTDDGNADDLSSLIPDNAAAIHATTSDLDDDGDLDLVIVTGDGKLRSLMNTDGNSNQWIEIVARAVGDDPQFPSNRVNMHGIGSVIELRTGATYQAHVIDSPKLHIGLGQAKSVDTIRIIWTDGVPQHLTKTELLRARLGVLAPQILSGSCPYIYTWNGERFEFFSDCLWAAPIGLVQATGDLAPTREWEYLKIPGRQLQPRNGRYVLQLTEELWEAAYFDEVKLVAVDHPSDVSIFTNEKVGSPQMAAHRIHTVKNARAFQSIRDRDGRDLTSGLKAQDQEYVQPFRGRILQGLTDEWTMEFDPGPLSENGEAPKDIRLFLIGWVFPTNTSLNHAIVQNPNLDPPAPPSLEVIDADGSWNVVRPFIGFPSGKTKAMVVDLSGVFPTDDCRFRIRSSMELYWDMAFLTVNESDVSTQSQDCPVVSADLHYRGFSRRVYAENALFRNGYAPESYDYNSVTTEPRWSEMLGRFTRYGDAKPLITSSDDQMVVMGPGDELTLEFAVPENPPPAGWTRDFVLYNVGWDKDADLNTVYGQSSEPYPFRAMTRYPLAPEESEPASPEYQRYLQEFQTREYSGFQFRDVVRDER